MKNQINSTIENIKNKLKTKSICIPARGESMLPTIRPNQKVIVDAISPNSIYIGDIVLFQVQNMMIIHRLIYKEKVDDEVLFLTRGDACDSLDDWVVHENNIIGVCHFKMKSEPFKVEK